MITLHDANDILKQGHPLPSQPGQDPTALSLFPFARQLELLWTSDKRYPQHGPAVLEAMNSILAGNLEQVLRGDHGEEHVQQLQDAIFEVQRLFRGWGARTSGSHLDALLRVCALYHDIGKYIVLDRHPMVGWYTVQYVDPEQREQLRELLLGNEDYLQLVTIIIRDHDHFGVLNTGEASYPILLRAAHSLLRGTLHDDQRAEDQKRIISALVICTLADMAGTFKVDGETVDKLLRDWRWFCEAIDYCAKNREHLDDYVIKEASSIALVQERIRRLLQEASREWDVRRRSLNNMVLINDAFATVFATSTTQDEFALQFTHICKLDYGKRFFVRLIDYCEREHKDDIDVIYSILGILKRITITYAAMMRTESGRKHLIGVELNALAPIDFPEKTARIVELIIRSHYPGLTWMMSDVPAWYF